MELAGQKTEHRKVEVDLKFADLADIIEVVLPASLEFLKSRGLDLKDVLVSGYFRPTRDLHAPGYGGLYLTPMEALAEAGVTHNPLRYAIDEAPRKNTRHFIGIYDRNFLANLGHLDIRQDFESQDFIEFSNKEMAKPALLAEIEITQSN